MLSSEVKELGVPSRKGAFLFVGIGVGIWLLVEQFETAVVAEVVGVSTVAMLFAGRLWWPFRQQRRAWAVVAAFALVHLILLICLPWPPAHRPARGDMLFLLLDLILVVTLSSLIERHTRPPEAEVV